MRLISYSRKVREIDLYREIYNERDHRCEVCGELITAFNPVNYAHILPKGSYGFFRIRKKNIRLMCFGCHYKFDHQTHMAKANPLFNWVFKLQEQLSRQYKRLENLFYLSQ